MQSGAVITQPDAFRIIHAVANNRVIRKSPAPGGIIRAQQSVAMMRLAQRPAVLMLPPVSAPSTGPELNVYIGPADGAPEDVSSPHLLILREPGAVSGQTSIVIREPGNA